MLSSSLLSLAGSGWELLDGSGDPSSIDSIEWSSVEISVFGSLFVLIELQTLLKEGGCQQALYKTIFS
jgi:hypothetical protein